MGNKSSPSGGKKKQITFFIKSVFTLCHKNAIISGCRQDALKRFSDMESTIPFAYQWVCFGFWTKLQIIAIFHRPSTLIGDIRTTNVPLNVTPCT